MQVLSPSGEPLFEFSGDGGGSLEGGLRNPSGVCFTEDHMIVATDRGNSRIAVISKVMSVHAVFGKQGTLRGELQGPIGVCMGPKGTIYVADYGNNRVQQFLLDGTFVKAFGGKGGCVGEPSLFTYPQDVAYMPAKEEGGKGRILVADTGSNTVVLMEEDGCDAFPPPSTVRSR